MALRVVSERVGPNLIDLLCVHSYISGYGCAGA